MAVVLPVATWPLVDSDVWWHIRAGEEVLRTGAVPRVDTWSIVGYGHPWVSQDWLANVLLAAGNRLGGWGQTALSLGFGLMVVASFAILWSAIRIRVASSAWVSRILWLGLGLVLASFVVGVRAQVFDLLFACAVLWICWRFAADRRRKWLIGLPVTAVLWANLHGGWLLLFLIGGAVLAGEALDRLLRREVADQPPLGWQAIGELAAALVVSVAAIGINPNGLALYTYPFETASISALAQYIVEWAPPRLDSILGLSLAAFVVVGVVPALVLGRRRLRAADALLLVGLTLMSVQASRFLLITGPIGAAVIAVVLSPVISASSLGRALAGSLRRLAEPRAGVAGAINIGLVVAVGAVGITAATLRVSPASQAAEINRRLPAAAVAWLNEHDVGQRMFNRYEWGGFIGLMRPDHLIFMDGRTDVYGDDAMHMYASLVYLEADPTPIFDRYGIDHAVAQEGSLLGDWLDASDAWERVYTDDVTAIWVRSMADSRSSQNGD